MKKLFVTLLIVLCGAVSLYADDVADVKAVIVRDCEFAAKGDFHSVIARWTPDYRETSWAGTFGYAQTKRLIISLDGKHPVEYLTTLVMLRNGAEPTPDMAEKIRQAAQRPEFFERYQDEVKQMADVLKRTAALELKTLKFVNVEVDGDKATAVLIYRQAVLDANVCEIVSLRKIDGEWWIARRVLKKL